jgi:hypothetical protein
VLAPALVLNSAYPSGEDEVNPPDKVQPGFMPQLNKVCLLLGGKAGKVESQPKN